MEEFQKNVGRVCFKLLPHHQNGICAPVHAFEMLNQIAAVSETSTASFVNEFLFSVNGNEVETKVKRQEGVFVEDISVENFEEAHPKKISKLQVTKDDFSFKPLEWLTNEEEDWTVNIFSTVVKQSANETSLSEAKTDESNRLDSKWTKTATVEQTLPSQQETSLNLSPSKEGENLVNSEEMQKHFICISSFNAELDNSFSFLGLRPFRTNKGMKLASMIASDLIEVQTSRVFVGGKTYGTVELPLSNCSLFIVKGIPPALAFDKVLAAQSSGEKRMARLMLPLIDFPDLLDIKEILLQRDDDAETADTTVSKGFCRVRSIMQKVNFELLPPEFREKQKNHYRRRKQGNERWMLDDTNPNISMTSPFIFYIIYNNVPLFFGKVVKPSTKHEVYHNFFKE